MKALLMLAVLLVASSVLAEEQEPSAKMKQEAQEIKAATSKKYDVLAGFLVTREKLRTKKPETLKQIADIKKTLAGIEESYCQLLCFQSGF